MGANTGVGEDGDKTTLTAMPSHDIKIRVLTCTERTVRQRSTCTLAFECRGKL